MSIIDIVFRFSGMKAIYNRKEKYKSCRRITFLIFLSCIR